LFPNLKDKLYFATNLLDDENEPGRDTAENLNDDFEVAEENEVC
jgi:hypothetical protein